jgi:TonB family protein
VAISAVTLAAKIPERCVTSMGIPTFPRLGQRARIEGTVKVGIAVDEAGAVVKATAISGHQLLQAVAAENAKTWHFAPVNGKTSVLLITYEHRIEGQEIKKPGDCPKVSSICQ